MNAAKTQLWGWVKITSLERVLQPDRILSVICSLRNRQHTIKGNVWVYLKCQLYWLVKPLPLLQGHEEVGL